MMLSKSKFTYILWSSLKAAEAMAILKAINLAICEGWKYIVCESDAKTVIQALNNLTSFPPHLAALGFIKNILSKLLSFNSVSFAWSSKTCNRLAFWFIQQPKRVDSKLVIIQDKISATKQ